MSLPFHLMIFVIVVAISGTGTHAQNWIPYRCCPNTDCQVIESTSVTEVQGGYVVEGIEEVVARDDPRVQSSRNGQFHACIRSNAKPFMSVTEAILADQKKELKCLFVPLTG
jgi:hypothetical protein